MTQAFNLSHSADVAIWLDCGAHGRLTLSRVTPKSVVARTAREIPPCMADLVVRVDGQYMRNRVKLASGFSKGRRVGLILPAIDDLPF